MVDHAPPLRVANGAIVDMSSGIAGFEDCRSLFAHQRNEVTTKDRNLAAIFSGTQQASGKNELGNDFRLLGTEDNAGGPAGE